MAQLNETRINGNLTLSEGSKIYVGNSEFTGGGGSTLTDKDIEDMGFIKQDTLNNYVTKNTIAGSALGLVKNGANGNVKINEDGTMTAPTGGGEGGYNPNLLINGSFQVWQRGDYFECYGGDDTASQHCADKWVASTTDSIGGTLNVTKIDNGIELDLITSDEYIRTDSYLFQYLNEPLNLGEYYTLSAKINDEIQNITFIIEEDYEYDEGLDNPVTEHEYFHITGTHDPLKIKLPKGTTTIEWVKLEKGEHATPLIPRLYEEELLLCQKYYYIIPLSRMMCYFDYSGHAHIYNDWVANHMGSYKTVRSSDGYSYDSDVFYIVFDYDNLADETIGASGNASPYYSSEYKEIIIPLEENTIQCCIGYIYGELDPSISYLYIEASDS